MAIIAGQRVLRKSMSADVTREWAPIVKQNASGRAAASRCRFLRGTQRGHNPDKRELRHIRSPGSTLLRCPVGATPARGRANVDAADGILVVQIRRVRAIFREVFQLAAALINASRRICDNGAWVYRCTAASHFPGARFLLADQRLAIVRSTAHGVALIPRQKLVKRPARV
jgi:hypothetical protein